MLRASGLCRVEGVGAKARLVLDPTILAQWDRLNPTEQYFNLLEAWLRFGRVEMVGEKGSSWGTLELRCLQTWTLLPQKGRRFNTEKPHEVYLSGVGRHFYLLALMDLFGLVEVKQPRGTVATWCPAGVDHVPFGDAVFTLIAHTQMEFLFGEIDSPQGEEEEEQEEEEEDEDEGAQEDEDEGPPDVPQFGAWQPLFRPYFPEWRENLVFRHSSPITTTF